jgi:hypothetical protein
VAMGTEGRVYTSIKGGQPSQHPSIPLLRHEVSCVFNGQTPGALHMEQTGIYPFKRLGDSKLCNVMRFESISRSPTLAYNRDILEHRYAAKEQSVHSI